MSYLTHDREHPNSGLAIPSTATSFEVVTAGRIHQVSGSRLRTWIEIRRHELKVPRELRFSKRPMIED